MSRIAFARRLPLAVEVRRTTPFWAIVTNQAQRA